MRAIGGAEVWHQAAVTLQNGVLGGIGTAIETTAGAVRDQAQNMVIGARMYGQQAATALATSAVTWGRAALPVIERAGVAAGRAIGKRIAQAGVASLIDGPLPAGEIVGIGLIAGGVIEAGFKATFAVMDAMEE